MAKRNQDEIDMNDVVRGEAALATVQHGGSLEALSSAQALTMDASVVEAEVRTGKASMETVLILEPGRAVGGKLLGRGGDIMVNRADGPNEEFPDGKQPVKTWRIQVTPNVVAIILSSANLESRLPPLEGKQIKIARMPPIRSGGKLINQYVITETLA